MSHAEPPSHTFLIRIWIEELPEESGRLLWRGHIVHLPDQERRYVHTCNDIARFIRAYVATEGSTRYGSGPPSESSRPRGTDDGACG